MPPWAEEMPTEVRGAGWGHPGGSGLSSLGAGTVAPPVSALACCWLQHPVLWGRGPNPPMSWNLGPQLLFLPWDPQAGPAWGWSPDAPGSPIARIRICVLREAGRRPQAQCAELRGRGRRAVLGHSLTSSCPGEARIYKQGSLCPGQLTTKPSRTSQAEAWGVWLGWQRPRAPNCGYFQFSKSLRNPGESWVPECRDQNWSWSPGATYQFCQWSNLGWQPFLIFPWV